MTFDLPLAQVDAARLEALRADGVRESRQLDYKETLPGNSDDDKGTFLAVRYGRALLDRPFAAAQWGRPSRCGRTEPFETTRLVTALVGISGRRP